jgi:hypothetical protein
MSRITEKMLYNRTAHIEKMCHELGLIKSDEELRIDLGSKYYGQAFRLWVKAPDSTGHNTPPFGRFLGMTKPETMEALNLISETLHVVQRMN